MLKLYGLQEHNGYQCPCCESERYESGVLPECGYRSTGCQLHKEVSWFQLSERQLEYDIIPISRLLRHIEMYNVLSSTTMLPILEVLVDRTAGP